MIFEWDERKRLSNLRKHGVDFRDAAIVFAGHMVPKPHQCDEYGEYRFSAIGWLRDRVVMVVYIDLGEVVRIISMRKADHYEQTFYFQKLKD